MTQTNFFPALFPVSDENSNELLVGFFYKACDLWVCPEKVNLIDNIFIDFFKETINRHKDDHHFEHMPRVVRRELAEMLAQKVIDELSTNGAIELFKAKLFELYHILVIVAADPESIVRIGYEKLKYYIYV